MFIYNVNLIMRLTQLTVLFALTLCTRSYAQSGLFIEGPASLCIGECAIYELMSVNGQVIDAHWEVISGNPDPGAYTIIQNTPMLEICFFSEGVYQIQLSNQQDTISIEPLIVEVFGFSEQIFVGGAICTDFDPNNQRPVCSTYCEGAIGIFSIDFGSTAEVEWSVTGGEIIQNFGYEIHVRWTDPGQHFVSAFGFGGNCSFEATECVLIVGEAEAEIIADPPPVNGLITLCSNETVTLESSGNNIAESQWILSNGMQASGSVFATSFASAGTYEVLLVTDNGCSCGDTASVEIEVLPDIAPTLDCIGTVCEGTTVTYTAFADCNQFDWSVSANGQILEGGQPSDDFVTIEWHTGPVGIITLLTSDCNTTACAHPVDFMIPIISPTADIAGDQRVCPGDVSTYRAPSWNGVYYQWDVSTRATILDGQGTPEITVLWASGGALPDAGQFVEVFYDGCYLDCGGSARLDVTILTDFEISAPVQACPGEQVFFQSQTIYAPFQQVSCDWQLIDRSGNVIAVENGTDLAEFTAPPTPGDYRVIALPMDPSVLCSAQKEQLLRVNEIPPQPSEIVGPDTICPGNPALFEVLIPPGTQAHWEINDGGNILSHKKAKVSHIFGNIPPHSISVSFEKGGCFSEPVSLDLSIFDPGEIRGPDAVCRGNIETYNVIDLDLASYDWSISPPESGSILSGQGTKSVEVIWLKPGIAQIALNSCGSSVNLDVEILRPIDITLDHADSICPGEVTTVSTVGNFAEYLWRDISGNEIGNNSTIDLEAGSYQLEVMDVMGCSNRKNFTIYGLQGPKAVISTPDPKGYCPADPDRHIFANNTEAGLSFQWYFNGNPLPGENAEELVTHPYGEYQALVTDQNGCSSWSNIIRLFEHCLPRQTPGGAVCNLPVNNCPSNIDLVFNVITSPQCNQLSFRTNSVGVIPGSQTWFFENFDAFNYDEVQEESPTHTFAEAGYYDVVLFSLMEIMPGPDTCFYHTNQIITIPVAADFSFQEACPGSAINFENLSTFIPGEDIVSTAWDFGDPASGPDNTSADYHPQHIYYSPGDYTVNLTVTAESGCTATTSKVISIPSPPENGFNLSNEGCPGITLDLNADNVRNFSAWIVNTPGGSSDTFFIDQIPYVFDETGIYEVRLRSENILGCVTDSIRLIEIEPLMVDRSLIYTLPDPLCDGSSFTLEAPSGGVNWDWNTGDQNATMEVVRDGRYWVVVETPEGCLFQSDTLAVTFDPTPFSSIGAFVENSENSLRDGPFFGTIDICAEQAITIEAFFSDNYTIFWNNGPTGTTQTFNPAANTGLPIGSHTFYADLFDPVTQCSGMSDTLTVIVHPIPSSPILTTSPTGPFCEGDPVDISIANPETGMVYLWNIGETGTDITVSAAGIYTVTAISPFGCSSVSEPVIISRAPDKRWVPSGCLERCRPDTICIPSFDPSIQIQWFKDGSPISGAIGNEFIATEDGVYQAQMIDAMGCQSLSDPLNLMLFDGFGDIGVRVWRDVDGDGTISAMDTLVEYTEVILNYQGSERARTPASPDLTHYFVHEPQGEYVAIFDSSTLLPEDEVIIGHDSISILGCDRSFEGDLLLGTGCPVDSFDYNVQVYFDLDRDGEFGPADSLASNFDVLIDDGNMQVIAQTDDSGIFNYLTEGSYHNCCFA
jgi:PKD repeat protein